LSGIQATDRQCVPVKLLDSRPLRVRAGTPAPTAGAV